jgi:nucleotide-binding universal stress UspA family protein
MDNLSVLVKIAAMLAEQNSGHTTYFSVLPENFNAEDLEYAKHAQATAISSHSGLATYETGLFVTDNPLEAIIEHSKNLDVLLIGSAPAHNMEKDSLVGSFSNLIIEQAHCSVIIVRRTPGFGKIIPKFISNMFTFEK